MDRRDVGNIILDLETLLDFFGKYLFSNQARLLGKSIENLKK